MDDPAGAGRFWKCRIPATGGQPARLVNVESARHPDGTVLELDPEQARAQICADAVCTATFAGRGKVARLELTHRTAPKAPPLWFAEIRESAARPPAVHLVAFTGHDQPAGVLLDQSMLASLPVRSADQLAALRWYPGTGEVDQVYVQPAWRRRTIAGGLVIAAATLAVAYDWPQLWGDGQRTALGEELLGAVAWGHRGAPLTHLVPPMTPGDPG
jgi:hypothetical protein